MIVTRNAGKVCHQVPVARHHKGITGIVGNLGAVLCPVGEFITRVGSGCQCAGCTIIIIACASNGAAFNWIGSGCYGVAAQLKVGHITCVFGYSETVCRIGRDHRPVLHPVREVVACVGCGSQGTGAAFSIAACSSHSTTFYWVCRGCDDVAAQLKVGHITCIPSHSETVCRIGRDDSAVLRPVDEVVACVGRSCQGAGCTIIIIACSGHSTAFSWIGSGCDGVAA